MGAGREDDPTIPAVQSAAWHGLFLQIFHFATHSLFLPCDALASFLPCLQYMKATAGQGSDEEEGTATPAAAAAASSEATHAPAAAATPAASAPATAEASAPAAAAPAPNGQNAINADLSSQYPMGVNPNPNAFGRVVMIHRAILGSLERFIAILCEHYAGKWSAFLQSKPHTPVRLLFFLFFFFPTYSLCRRPFWLSPRQTIVLPVGETQLPYAQEVAALLRQRGYVVDVDESNRKLPKKVREAQLAGYNMMLVVGAEEVRLLLLLPSPYIHCV